LIEAALEACPDQGAALRVLDLGTGTGALLLAVLSELPSASGVGIDLKPEAAALAARNAARLGLAGRACFLAGDWAAALTGRFDLVLCNPPYIECAAIAGLMPEVGRHEPASALDGGTDGLAAYRPIIADLPRLLAPRGVAVLELGQGQQAAVEALARAAGLTPEACRADLGGVPRALVLRLRDFALGAAGPRRYKGFAVRRGSSIPLPDPERRLLNLILSAPFGCNRLGIQDVTQGLGPLRPENAECGTTKRNTDEHEAHARPGRSPSWWGRPIPP
jgi:SAM-dependent methyltransferase